MARRIALLAGALLMGAFRPQEKIPVLLLTGSHRHDWVNTTPILKKFLEDTGRFEVTVSEDPPGVLTPETLRRYRAVLLHYRETDRPMKFEILDESGNKTGRVREVPARPGRWPAACERAFLEAVENGLGVVAIHYATSAFDEGDAHWPEYEKLVGGGWRVTKKQFGHGTLFQFKVKVVDRDHPITRGFPPEFLHSKDELYHKSLMVDGNRVLCTGFDDPAKGGPKCTGRDENLAWVRTHGKGRVFTTVLGHGPDQMRLSPGFQALVARGTEWAATGEVTLPLPPKLDADPVQ